MSREPMREAEIAESRARWQRVRSDRAGICGVCGYHGTNVVHDPPDERAWNVEHIYRYDYYADAGVSFHPFARVEPAA